MGESMAGKQFGRLTVLKEVRQEGTSRRYWLCRCACGTETVVEESHLKNGHTKSCGCYRRDYQSMRRKEITGQRFGRLTVLKRMPEKEKGRWMYLCRCDCGKQCVCGKENLLSGITKSCGCLREEVRKENMKKAIHFVDGTCVERIASRKTFANNTTGHRGVYRRSNGRWRASIGFQGKIYNLGSYAQFEDAVNARLEAEEKFFDTFLKEYRGDRA